MGQTGIYFKIGIVQIMEIPGGIRMSRMYTTQMMTANRGLLEGVPRQRRKDVNGESGQEDYCLQSERD